MTNFLRDPGLGLQLRGYKIVPNAALETVIAVHTPDVVESILTASPEVMDTWLEKLHREYINNKKSCDFESDPVACFTLSVFEEFERHLRSWDDGGIIAISLPGERVLRISKKPVVSIVSEAASTGKPSASAEKIRLSKTNAQAP